MECYGNDCSQSHSQYKGKAQNREQESGSIWRSAIAYEDTFFSVELPSIEARTHPILPFSLPVCHWILRHCLHFCLFNRLQASPKKRMVHGDHEEALDGGQAEKGHQAVWNPEQGERNPLRLICSSIASQPLVPC